MNRLTYLVAFHYPYHSSWSEGRYPSSVSRPGENTLSDDAYLRRLRRPSVHVGYQLELNTSWSKLMSWASSTDPTLASAQDIPSRLTYHADLTPAQSPYSLPVPYGSAAWQCYRNQSTTSGKIDCYQYGPAQLAKNLLTRFGLRGAEALSRFLSSLRACATTYREGESHGLDYVRAWC